ncbi:hypothetical protein HUZ88_14775 [Citrobacter portucalensis]|uniref:hypothetical protein n=1 Tax=Citrobacter portucalensis TaxID=1639133 RepID=UPI001EF7C468|nr:hypothetical protein [Citrobacter portucalensis]ULK54222.1 hypothetical protein HUZ88_14775 [Citrobacter portucalensis]
MSKNNDDRTFKEKKLTNIIKILLVIVILGFGFGISTILGGVSEGNKWVLGLCGALGGFVSMLMSDVAKARIDLRKIKAGVKVGRYKRKSKGGHLRNLSLMLATLIVARYVSEPKKNTVKSKAETITELFLFDKQDSLNAAKKIALWGIVVNAVMYFFIDLPFATTGLFFGIIALLQIKEELLIYRVNHGYFGSTTREAMMLIKFINDQDDDSDMNSGGRRKPVFKDATTEGTKEVGGFVGVNR